MAYDRNITNNVTVDLTMNISLTTTPNLDGSGGIRGTCNAGQLTMGLCDPGIYDYTYSVVDENGQVASAVRRLIVYNTSYFTLTGIVAFPAMAAQATAALICSNINSGDATSSNYTAATAAIANQLSSFGILSKDIDLLNASMAARLTSPTVTVYDVFVSVTIWWYYPSVVHRSHIQSYNAAISKQDVPTKAARKALALEDAGHQDMSEDESETGGPGGTEGTGEARAALLGSNPLERDVSSYDPGSIMPENTGRRTLMDTSDSIRGALGALSVTSKATSKAVDVMANTLASVEGLVTILLDQSTYASTTAISNIAGGISSSISRVRAGLLPRVI